MHELAVAPSHGRDTHGTLAATRRRGRALPGTRRRQPLCRGQLGVPHQRHRQSDVDAAGAHVPAGRSPDGRNEGAGMSLSRRRTLQLLVAALAAGAVPGAAAATLCTQWAVGLDMSTAGALGREYLGRYPLDPALKEVLTLLRTP